MKKEPKAIAAIMLITTMFCGIGCTKPDDPNYGNDSPIETNLMDGSIEEIMDFNGLSIETMYDKVALNGKSFSVEIGDCDIPQFIAVTDADTNCYMLYRGRLDKNVPVVIDANSTALALVTMHPVLPPRFTPTSPTMCCAIPCKPTIQGFSLRSCIFGFVLVSLQR